MVRLTVMSQLLRKYKSREEGGIAMISKYDILDLFSPVSKTCARSGVERN